MNIQKEAEKWLRGRPPCGRHEEAPIHLHFVDVADFARHLSEKYELIEKDSSWHVKEKSCCYRNPCSCLCHDKPEGEKPKLHSHTLSRGSEDCPVCQKDCDPGCKHCEGDGDGVCHELYRKPRECEHDYHFWRHNSSCRKCGIKPSTPLPELPEIEPLPLKRHEDGVYERPPLSDMCKKINELVHALNALRTNKPQ